MKLGISPIVGESGGLLVDERVHQHNIPLADDDKDMHGQHIVLIRQFVAADQNARVPALVGDEDDECGCYMCNRYKAPRG